MPLEPTTLIYQTNASPGDYVPMLTELHEAFAHLWNTVMATRVLIQNGTLVESAVKAFKDTQTLALAIATQYPTQARLAEHNDATGGFDFLLDEPSSNDWLKVYILNQKAGTPEDPEAAAQVEADALKFDAIRWWVNGLAYWLQTAGAQAGFTAERLEENTRTSSIRNTLSVAWQRFNIFLRCCLLGDDAGPAYIYDPCTRLYDLRLSLRTLKPAEVSVETTETFFTLLFLARLAELLGQGRTP